MFYESVRTTLSMETRQESREWSVEARNKMLETHGQFQGYKSISRDIYIPVCTVWNDYQEDHQGILECNAEPSVRQLGLCCEHFSRTEVESTLQEAPRNGFKPSAAPFCSGQQWVLMLFPWKSCGESCTEQIGVGIHKTGETWSIFTILIIWIINTLNRLE